MAEIHGVTPNSILFTESGFITAEDVQLGTKLSDPSDSQLEVTAVERNTVDSYLKIELSDGFTFLTSKDQPIMNEGGEFISASVLQIEDLIPVPRVHVPGVSTLPTKILFAKAMARGLVMRKDQGDSSFEYKILVPETKDTEIQELLTPELSGILASLLEETPTIMLTRLIPIVLKTLTPESQLSLIQAIYKQAVNRVLIFSRYADGASVRAIMYALGLRPYYSDLDGSCAISLKDSTPEEGTTLVKIKSITVEQKDLELITLTVSSESRFVADGLLFHNQDPKPEVFVPKNQGDIIAYQRGELLKESVGTGQFVLSDQGLVSLESKPLKILTTTGLKDAIWSDKLEDLVEITTERGYSVQLPETALVIESDGTSVITQFAGKVLKKDSILISLVQCDSKKHTDLSVLVEESARKREFPPYVMAVTNPIKLIYLRHWALNHGTVTKDGFVFYPELHKPAQTQHLMNMLASLGFPSKIQVDGSVLLDRDIEDAFVREAKLYTIYQTDLAETRPPMIDQIIPESSLYNNKLVRLDRVSKVELIDRREIFYPSLGDAVFPLNSILVSIK